MTVYLVAGLIFATGFALNFYINRRKFNRRNVAGLETFGSYEKALATTIAEKIGKFLGLALMIIGAAFIFMQWFNDRSARQHHEKQIKEQQLKK